MRLAKTARSAGWAASCCGVAGFSGTGRQLAPLITPGDSFEVHFTPPRSGTFICHVSTGETHDFEFVPERSGELRLEVRPPSKKRLFTRDQEGICNPASHPEH